MNTTTAIAPPPNPITTAATNLMSVLWAAEYRRLPLPFASRCYEADSRIEIQFHTRAEVVAWAEAMGVDVGDNLTATGELLDVTVTVCAWVPEEVTP